MNAKELQTTLRHFAAERDWHQFHSPKNLTTALMVEAAELAEIFQWMTTEESRHAHESPDTKGRVGEEVADVLLYLLQVADHCQIDITEAARAKIEKNAVKHLPKRRIEYPKILPPAKPPETHVLLDYENVQPTEIDLRTLVSDVTDLWLFHGPHQKHIERRFTTFDTRVTMVPIHRTGKNALDFHLSYYMGYITSRNPGARFVVVANDKGYDPMLDHAKELGFAVERRTFSREPLHIETTGTVSVLSQSTAPTQKVAAKAAAPAKAPPKKATPSKPAAAKKAAVKKVPPQTPKKAAPSKSAVAKPVSKKSAQTAALKSVSTSSISQAKIVANLKKMGNKRPAKMAALRRTVQMLLGLSSSDDALTASINNLIARGSISIGQGGDLTYKL